MVWDYKHERFYWNDTLLLDWIECHSLCSVSNKFVYRRLKNVFIIPFSSFVCIMLARFNTGKRNYIQYSSQKYTRVECTLQWLKCVRKRRKKNNNTSFPSIMREHAISVRGLKAWASSICLLCVVEIHQVSIVSFRFVSFHNFSIHLLTLIFISHTFTLFIFNDLFYQASTEFFELRNTPQTCLDGSAIH